MRPLVLIWSLLLFAGCLRPATIHLKNGKSVKARIESSDAKNICLGSEAGSRPVCMRAGSLIRCPEIERLPLGRTVGFCAAREVVLPRADVEDIDHPGLTIAIVGTSLLAADLVAALVPLLAGDPDLLSSAEFLVPLLLIGAPSLFTAVWGWTTWGISRSAATPDGTAHLDPGSAPSGVRKGSGIGTSTVG